jgi:hypothetical protein
MPCHHILFRFLPHSHTLVRNPFNLTFYFCYPRPSAFSSGSLSAFALLLLNKLMMPARFPSGLLEKTLERRLVPSAFVLTGYITSEGLPARLKESQISFPILSPSACQPTNISCTTDAVALFPFNGNPPVLTGVRHPSFRCVCSIGWQCLAVKLHPLLGNQLLKARILI